MRNWLRVLVWTGTLAWLVVTLISCPDDEAETPTGSEAVPAQAAQCVTDCVDMFSETCKWLFYIPPKIAGLRELPQPITFYRPDQPTAGYYLFFTDRLNDGDYDFAVDGDTWAPASGWTGGLYNGDVVRFEWHCKRWGTLDTVGTGTSPL